MARRILITGGSGLVGHGLKNAIQSLDTSDTFLFLSSKDADLLILDHIEQIFKSFQPTHVIHLAAKVGGLFANMAANADFYIQNSTMNQNIFLLCHKYKVEKLISCLSTCIFPYYFLVILVQT